MSAAGFIVGLMQIWGGLGLIVAIAFLAFGISRIDEDARGAIAFRPLLLPGLILLWPVVLWRWWILATGRDQWEKRHDPPRRAHGLVWAVLLVVIPVTLISALALRQSWPADAEAIQLNSEAEGS